MNSVEIHHPLVTCWCLIEQVMRKIQEIWKQIPICANGYQASSLGNVRRLTRKLKYSIDHRGYYRAPVKLLNGDFKGRLVHRLVALTFIPNPKNKPQVNHIDGDKLNNAVPNLEWATPSENVRHSFANGLQVAVHGSSHYLSKLTEDKVREIRTRKLSCLEYATKFGVSYETANRAQNKITWKHV